ncbi:MAG: hypothetical protein WBD10_03555 [Acidobacteriaceae bacterium]
MILLGFLDFSLQIIDSVEFSGNLSGFVPPCKPKAGLNGPPGKVGLKWHPVFEKQSKKLILILKTKDLINLDPVNKGLTGFDPGNKGFSSFWLLGG